MCRPGLKKHIFAIDNGGENWGLLGNQICLIPISLQKISQVNLKPECGTGISGFFQESKAYLKPQWDMRPQANQNSKIITFTKESQLDL